MIKAIFRELVRYYLRSCPLRDGKRLLYDTLNQVLAPARGQVEVELPAGFRLRLDLKEPAQRMIYFFGNYDERHELAMLRRLLSPGDIFWDIGANIGFYTLTASFLVGQGGRVLSFEPGAESWRALLDNLEINRVGNVRPFKMAVSESEGWVTLYSRPDLADGGASLLARPGAACREELCPATTLDRLYRDQGLQAPTFLKIDVEGAEERVLKGGREVLSAGEPPLLLIEMNDPLEVGGLLKDLGFAGAHLVRGRWRRCPDPAAPASRNMLWYHPHCGRHTERLERILAG